MTRAFYAALTVTALAACGGGNPNVALTDSAGGDIALAPSSSGGAINDRPLAATRTLGSGSQIDASWGVAITSRSNKAGESVTVNVRADVNDRNGRVVIPAGSTVDLLITQLAPAENRNQADGKLALSVNSAMIRGRRYDLHGTVGAVAHTLEGRGIGRSAATKVGVGAAVGAVAGQVIGKNTKSTVIGGAVGAAGGAVVAAQTADRDVVVSSGTPVVITLTSPLTVSMK